MRTIVQSFPVQYSYPVVFTRASFEPDNTVLRDLFLREGPAQHQRDPPATSLSDLCLRPLPGEKLSKITGIVDDERVRAVHRDITRDDRV